jgi:hypothetical protein
LTALDDKGDSSAARYVIMNKPSRVRSVLVMEDLSEWKTKVAGTMLTKVPSMSFYPDFNQILSGFYLDFIQILLRFYLDFIQILFIFYPDIILILSVFSMIFSKKSG